jgi:hypothetical protein
MPLPWQGEHAGLGRDAFALLAAAHRPLVLYSGVARHSLHSCTSWHGIKPVEKDLL